MIDDSKNSMIDYSTNGDPSVLAMIIYIVAWISIVGGFLWITNSKIENSQKSVILLSSVISGILMLGFGSVVDNLKKIEQHLRIR